MLDARLSSFLNSDERRKLWASTDKILSHRPIGGSTTELALGYVQSGKTTQMIALTAAAHDKGYRIVIALLGSTNLLLDQNADRFAKTLALDVRNDFRWVTLTNPNGRRSGQSIRDKLEMGRTLFVPVLKHSRRISQLAEVLSGCDLQSIPVLILDDEADQASMNTKVNQDSESKVYEAIGSLRNCLKQHLYIQFTATPYAPLLLEPDDHLAPEYVEFLTPGNGYVGGREFFIDCADKVVRTIPLLDEQSSSGKILELPESLNIATANFIAGSALLLKNDPSSKTVSMLVHSTHKNNIQEVYHFLMNRLISGWKETVLDNFESIPIEIRSERVRLVGNGVPDVSNDEFLVQVKYVLREMILWLVNSASDVKKINWLEGPIHVLVGGNKLDRGFTVEGLTVTYMNRPTSDQIDTLEQRARAFGYRMDLLPYCQFFATSATIRILRQVVQTEYDLRARLGDWIAEGNSPKDWAKEIGLLLPQGAKPTRSSVLKALTSFNAGGGWHQLRMPSLEADHLEMNREVLERIGLLNAPRADWGRLQHRTLELDSGDVLENILKPWSWDGFSPGWDQDQILQLFESLGPNNASGLSRSVSVLLMQYENEDKPRQREWRSDTGFLNLFQGKDASFPAVNTYPGDRAVPISSTGSDALALQVHRVQPKDANLPEVFTLAVYLGDSKIVKRRDQ